MKRETIEQKTFERETIEKMIVKSKDEICNEVDKLLSNSEIDTLADTMNTLMKEFVGSQNFKDYTHDEICVIVGIYSALMTGLITLKELRDNLFDWQSNLD